MRQDREKPPTELTAPHRAMIFLIQELDLQVIAEYPAGKYTLDCYLPEFHVGIEVDGPGHSKKRDNRRAIEIGTDYGIPVLHVAATDIVEVESTKCAILEFLHIFEDDIAVRRDVAKRHERGLDA